MKKLLFCLVCFSFSGQLHAQETLSLLECVNIAIENSLELEQTEYDYQNAFADYEQSLLEKYPSLNASTSHALNFGRSLDFTTYDFNTQTTQTNSFGVTAQATLFSGGRIKDNIELQKMLANRSKTNLKSLKDQIAITVAANFLNAISAKEQIRISELQVELRQRDVDRTERLIDEGAAAGATLYDMEAQLSNAEFQLQQAENNYQVALLELKQSMLYPFEEELEIVAPEIDTPPLQLVQEELNPEIVFRNALLTQGNIQGTKQDIAIAEQNIEIAESQKYPTISINGGLNSYHSSQGQQVIGTTTNETRIPVEGLSIPNQSPYISFINSTPVRDDAPFFDQISNNMSQNLGVSIQIPIFNRGQVNTQIEKAKTDVKRAQVQSEIQKRQLKQTIQSAYLDAILAHKALEAATTQVEMLEKSTEFAKKRYDIGTASIYDYFTTQNNLANAKVEATRAKYDYLYKVKILEFYKDNNFEF